VFISTPAFIAKGRSHSSTCLV